MDWSKVKIAIGTVAPWLAATLGSPMAGVAVQAVCGAIGLSGQMAAPEDVIAGIASASPEQLVALRAAELEHQLFMQRLGYESLSQLASIEAADKASARAREIALRDNTPDVLAGMAVVLFILALLFVVSGHAPDASMRDGFMIVLGALIATYKDVYGYYFGSSSSSKAKDETIRGMTQ